MAVTVIDVGTPRYGFPTPIMRRLDVRFDW
jgi:hypothetical protein